MDDQYGRGLEPEKRRRRAHAAPRRVHERLRLEHANAHARMAELCELPVEAGSKRNDASWLAGTERVDRHEPNVVPGLGVARPRIPEADQQDHFLAGALAAGALAAAAPAAGALAAPAAAGGTEAPAAAPAA